MMTNKKSLCLFLVLFYSCMSMAGPVVLITGASRGIGLVTTEVLAKAGYTVYASARKSSNLEALEELRTRFHDIRIIELDVTSDESVEQAVATIIEEQGRVDVLVNNAGVLAYGSLENMRISETEQVFKVNTFGSLRTINAVLPHMRMQNFGRIVQIGSRSDFRPLPSLSAYAASKFALVGALMTLPATHGEWNIHVSIIEPGPVDTDMDDFGTFGTNLDENNVFFEKFRNADLIGRSDSAQRTVEIAEFVKKAIEDENPQFRYQTTKAIEEQARIFLADPTGMADIREIQSILQDKGVEGEIHLEKNDL